MPTARCAYAMLPHIHFSLIYCLFLVDHSPPVCLHAVIFNHSLDKCSNYREML